MKVLTLLGTVVLPVLALSSIYGMNLKGLPFEDSPHGALYVSLVAVISTIALLLFLRMRRWL